MPGSCAVSSGSSGHACAHRGRRLTPPTPPLRSPNGECEPPLGRLSPIKRHSQFLKSGAQGHQHSPPSPTHTGQRRASQGPDVSLLHPSGAPTLPFATYWGAATRTHERSTRKEAWRLPSHAQADVAVAGTWSRAGSWENLVLGPPTPATCGHRARHQEGEQGSCSCPEDLSLAGAQRNGLPSARTDPFAVDGPTPGRPVPCHGA